MTLETQGQVTTLAPVRQGFDLPAAAETQAQLLAIQAFQDACHQHLIPEIDYGIIPGTEKPTLLKPGAEKLVRLLGLADEYAIESVKDWDKPFFHFQVTSYLRHLASGQIVATGVGECNSMEARFRWRQGKRSCPTCGAEAIIKGKEEYGGGWICFKRQDGCGAKFNDNDERVISQQVGRVENDDIYSQVNTILKMAKKRSLVDAALSAGRLSNVFTQDVEDLQQGTGDRQPAKPQERRPQQRAAANPKQQSPKQGSCEVHGRPFAQGPEGRIGHPLGEGEWCWQDEQDQTEHPSQAEVTTDSTDPTKGTLEGFKAHLESLGWAWGLFEEQVLDMGWEQFEELGGNPVIAWRRFQNYLKQQEEGDDDNG